MGGNETPQTVWRGRWMIGANRKGGRANKLGDELSKKGAVSARFEPGGV